MVSIIKIVASDINGANGIFLILSPSIVLFTSIKNFKKYQAVCQASYKERRTPMSNQLNKVISSPGSQPGRPQAAHPVKGGGRFGMWSLTTRTSLCAALSTEQDGDRGTAVGGPRPAGSLRMTLVWPSVPERPPLST